MNWNQSTVLLEYFAESMQHASLTSSTYPGSCKTCFFCIPVFGGKVFLIFPIIYLIVDLKLICIIGLSDLVNSDLCWQLSWMIHLLTLGTSFPVSWSVCSLISLRQDMCIFNVFDIRNYIEITQSIIPKPVYLLTVQEAHKEYNSLMDQIRAKYDQLDSGEFWAVGTPAFDAEACELANLLACESQLCQKLNLPPQKELYRPMFFKHWRCFLDQNSYARQAVCLGYGGCSFVAI